MGIKKSGGWIRSMTGFGKATVKCPYGTLTIEIKSLNNKHLNVSCIPFEGFFLLEERLHELFAAKIIRGKIFVKIFRDYHGQKKILHKAALNEERVKEYLKSLADLKRKFSIKGDVEIKDIISLPGVVEHDSFKKEETLWPYVKKASIMAVDKLVEYREKEGARLSKDFEKRLAIIKKNLTNIKKYEKESVLRYKNRLTQEVKRATGKQVADQSKLEDEVAIFARNCDIAEEVVRLDNHVEAYNQVLRHDKSDAGKKLDFIAQEMHREANTIGAKGNDYRISNAIIEVKSEIEKIREQLKNIE